MSRKRSLGVCILLGVVLLIVGWQPFVLFPKNQVHWIEGRAGLAFKPDSVACDLDPLSAEDAAGTELKGGTGFTIALWLEAGEEPTSDVTHILTIHDTELPSNLVLCQWKSQMLLRQPDSRKPRGFREVALNVLQKNRPVLVALTCGSGGTVYYVDGKVSSRHPHFKMPLKSLRGRLILGDAAGGKHCWTGNIYGLAIFDRVLDEPDIKLLSDALVEGGLDLYSRESAALALYPFSEGAGSLVEDLSPHQHRLTLSPRYRVLHRGFFEMPQRSLSSEYWDLGDIIINLVGFGPFGFAVWYYCRLIRPTSRLHGLFWAVLASAAISFVIELGQVWLPMRTSSFLDLVCNTVGGFCGAVLAAVFWKLKGSIRRSRNEPTQARAVHNR